MELDSDKTAPLLSTPQEEEIPPVPLTMEDVILSSGIRPKMAYKYPGSTWATRINKYGIKLDKIYNEFVDRNIKLADKLIRDPKNWSGYQYSVYCGCFPIELEISNRIHSYRWQFCKRFRTHVESILPVSIDVDGKTLYREIDVFFSGTTDNFIMRIEYVKTLATLGLAIRDWVCAKTGVN